PRCKAAKIVSMSFGRGVMSGLVANDKSQVQVIARAATILRALEEENAGLSLGQIAQRVNLARSTVQRIVAALETEKLVIAATPNGRVRLGPTILRLAASVRSDFVAMARPFLERLSEELHETVDLSTVKKDHLVFIDQVIGSQRLRAGSAVGDTFSPYFPDTRKTYLGHLSALLHGQRQGLSGTVIRFRGGSAARTYFQGAHPEDACASRYLAQ